MLHSLPIITVALLLGICSTLILPAVPSQAWAYSLLLVAIILLLLRIRRTGLLIAIALFGFGYMSYNINQHLAHTLPQDLEGAKITLIGTITSVVEDRIDQEKARFLFKVSKINNVHVKWALPALVKLSWDNPSKSLQPGDTWALKVKLKRPRNYANPGSFDSEKFFFQQRIVGLGYVVSTHENKCLATSYVYPIDRLRQYFMHLVQQHLAQREYADVILALTLGIKTNMSAERMQVLQNTGTAHLMAISGLHIGIIAALLFYVLRKVWRWLPATWLHISAPRLGAIAALIISIVYAALAGFSIATQRSLIMVLMFLFGLLYKRNITRMHSYCVALLAVLLWDPFVVLSLGFWFSFIAVALLLYSLRGRFKARDKFTRVVQYFKPQMVLTIGLLPISLLYFAQNSIIGPVANAIAIPWVGFFVIPLGVLAILSIPISQTMGQNLLLLAEHNFAYLWPWLEKLARLPTYVWSLPTANLWLIMLCAALGSVWLLMPRGIPGRWWGLLGFAPLLFGHAAVIPFGQAEFTLLDVGQGMSAVVRTQNHTLVYDTGAKINRDFDLGSRVVAPYLRAMGVKKIDVLMISHADNDHIGGTRGLLRSFTADTFVTSAMDELAEFNPLECRAGQHWEWDGVKFTVMHPSADFAYKKRNDLSCVLMVQAGEHKVLLTGDIEKLSEKQLIEHYGDNLHADVLLVPHHGSKTSSSLEFIQQVNPRYALIPVGYKNQYGHPKEPVLQRYQELNINVLRTEYDGAITMRLGDDAGLLPGCYRKQQRRFWLL